MIRHPSTLARNAFAILLSGLVVSACQSSGAGLPVAAKYVARPASSVYAYTSLYHFTGRHGDGKHPYARLTAFDGALYGTTLRGGVTTKDDKLGLGTVFKITLSGQETVLHRFKGGADGFYPQGLAVVKGVLYGITSSGGSYRSAPGAGTLFSIDAAGKKRIVHVFNYEDHCYAPTGNLIAIRGLLYVTCVGGGNASVDNGAVASVATSGTVHVLYGFKGSPMDGSMPQSGLILYNGNLYGTTPYGGRISCHYNYTGCGTAFRVSLASGGRTLYRFIGPRTGVRPFGGLAALNGMLYGTTSRGGTSGNGTVFSLTPSGKETVIHSFDYVSDGAEPYGGLLAYGGLLYGTTTTCCQEIGGVGGAIFSMSSAGTEQILHTFQGARSGDGAGPYASFIAYGGALYGTTAFGGGGNCNFGCGTIFRVVP